MAKYIIEIPDEVPVSDELVPFDMCRPSWYWEAYKKGKAEAEDEVWELAQKVDAMDNYSSGRCFGGDFFPIRENGYREAKDKFEKWCKRTDDIRVGDEVRCMERVGIVVRIDSMDSGRNVVWEDGATAYIGVKDLIKTGRHFDEVENLLERMREE